jgi:hypothetical protein
VCHCLYCSNLRCRYTPNMYGSLSISPYE